MHLQTRLRVLARWLFVTPRAFWGALLGPCASTGLAWLIPIAPEARIRAAGFLVTLLGVILVAKAIRDTQLLFDQPTLPSRFRKWLSQLPSVFGRSKVIHAEGTATLHVTSSGRAYVRAGVRDPSSLESRMDALEENLRRVDDRISGVEAHIDATVRRIDQSISAERQARDVAVGKVERRLKEYSAGSLDWEIVGAVWLIVGQALGSFPTEIAHVLQR